MGFLTPPVPDFFLVAQILLDFGLVRKVERDRAVHRFQLQGWKLLGNGLGGVSEIETRDDRIEHHSRVTGPEHAVFRLDEHKIWLVALAHTLSWKCPP